MIGGVQLDTNAECLGYSLSDLVYYVENDASTSFSRSAILILTDITL